MNEFGSSYMKLFSAGGHDAKFLSIACIIPNWNYKIHRYYLTIMFFPSAALQKLVNRMASRMNHNQPHDLCDL